MALSVIYHKGQISTLTVINSPSPALPACKRAVFLAKSSGFFPLAPVRQRSQWFIP